MLVILVGMIMTVLFMRLRLHRFFLCNLYISVILYLAVWPIWFGVTLIYIEPSFTQGYFAIFSFSIAAGMLSATC
jgi:hypothetical protein